MHRMQIRSSPFTTRCHRIFDARGSTRHLVQKSKTFLDVCKIINECDEYVGYHKEACLDRYNLDMHLIAEYFATVNSFEHMWFQGLHNAADLFCDKHYLDIFAD